jgi:hypothetical protein
MRARTQKKNILLPPRYEKDLSSILIYDDSDNVVFAVSETPAGTYKFTHLGLPDFKQEIKKITGMDVDNPPLHTLEGAKHGPKH